MLVQAIDGRWYKNPVFPEGKWILRCTQDESLLIYRGQVGWRTARQDLTDCKIKAKRLPDASEEVTEIIGGKMVNATQFKVKLLARIPVPPVFEASVSDATGADEEVLSWPAT